MKSLVFFFCIFSFHSAHSQVPDYFSDNPEWSQSRLCYMNNDTQNWDFVYYLNGDTLINNVNWHKVYKRGTYTVSGMGGSGGYTYNHAYQYIRQDSLKVYVLSNLTEQLLYDFDLSVGDALPITYNNQTNTIIVDSIQTLTINGDSRKQFFISGPNISVTPSFIIEGMGSNNGLYEEIGDILNCGHYFHCYSVNGVIEVGTNCNFDVNVDELIKEESISISPNPISDAFTISIPDQAQLKEINLIATNGAVQKLPFNVINEVEINGKLEDFAAGIYLLEVRLNNGQILRKKVVKQ